MELVSYYNIVVVVVAAAAVYPVIPLRTYGICEASPSECCPPTS
jgi:hypothetical protein